MYKYVLENVENIHVFSIASLLIFFVFFTLQIVMVFMKDKSEMSSYGDIPMNDGTLNDLDNND